MDLGISKSFKLLLFEVEDMNVENINQIENEELNVGDWKNVSRNISTLE